MPLDRRRRGPDTSSAFAEILIRELRQQEACQAIKLQRDIGMTEVKGQTRLDLSPWHWPD